MELLFMGIGIVIGGLLYYVLFDRDKAAGTFILDMTDPTKDICKLDLTESLNTVYSRKYIWLRVKVYEDNSQ